MKTILHLLFLAIILTSCNDTSKKVEEIQSEEIKVETVKSLSEKSKEIRDYIKPNIVIAHRGSTFWTPEETEPAFLWARNIGADYIEFDIQLTKDNQIVAFHDKNLKRTTNVSEVFPDRIDAEINDFTLVELRSLDAGTWFNKEFSDRARDSYVGIKIMTLKDVVMIAEGNRIKKKGGVPVKEETEGEWTGEYQYEKDPNDNGNRPGIYIETKNPKPNVESVFVEELHNLGWLLNDDVKNIETISGKISIANTKARVILQSFSLESLVTLEELVPQVPKALLLWQPKMLPNIKESYKKAIAFCIANNVQGIGQSIAGEPNNYKELSEDWMLEMIHDAGLISNPYTFDTNEQFEKYSKKVEGIFTNRADLALEFYNRKSEMSSEEILKNLGY